MTALRPPNATPLDTALAITGAAASDIPVPLATLWNPQTCPAALLPWLAWTLSVDVWDPDWPEATKRSVIARSFDVHRLKGTRGAVVRALEPLGVSLSIVEWWELAPAGTPHTFTIRVAAGGGVTAALYQQIVATVNAVKPVRSHYEIKVATHTATAIGVGAVVSAASMLRIRGNTA
ncbi:phage tail protein I [Azospirillum argentinense]